MSAAVSARPKMTIGQALADAGHRLAASGIESPRREARLLLALAAEIDAAAILGFPERPLAAAAALRLEALLQRRMAREPVSRLAGRREFWSLDFALSPDTLDPRPDSETLIAAALDYLPDRQAALRILDFGTGTGCLLLALLSELPRAVGVGLDIVPGAAAAARRNAEDLGLNSRAFFVVGSWDEAISTGVDVILANPPYISTSEFSELSPEVARYDPRLALDGGKDGLGAYRCIAPAARRLLKPGGRAFIELGAAQSEAAVALFAEAGLLIEEVRRDLADIERCLVLAAPSGA
jgi:release factor glutamine methyltransferase